jgi:predicted dienelactone hydrolase
MPSLMRTMVAACLLPLAALKPCLAEEAVGFREITVAAAERGRDLTATVWYPALGGGSRQMPGESAFFVGTAAMRDAPVARGQYPLILLSHGAGIAGTPSGVSWIATALTKQGFIVAAPMHPGNGGANRSAAETMMLWLRPGDISATLDAIGKTELFGPHIAPDKVGMLGLSMGGSTALALAGARFEAARLAAYCDSDTLNPSLCEWVRMSGVNLHAIDMRQAEESHEDDRLTFVMAVDPAPMDVLKPDSFSRIKIPVTIMNLGRTKDLPVTVRADHAAQLIAGATYSTIEDASHNSMFAECKPGAAETAIAEIGEPICADGGGRPRKDIHGDIVATALRAFDAALRQGR